VTFAVVSEVDAQLLTAAAAGDALAVRAALDAGASVEARDRLRRTPLLLAALGDHVDVARMLVAAGADPNSMDDRHDTPWLVTGATGSVPMLEVLLPAGADLTIRNRYGGVSVIPASERGHIAYVRRVVQTGIDVNHLNDLHWSALLEAVILGDGSETYAEIIRILLTAGADPVLADREGVTALEHAERLGHTRLAEVLRGTP
jgi:ankyrin repeat protein